MVALGLDWVFGSPELVPDSVNIRHQPLNGLRLQGHGMIDADIINNRLTIRH